MSKTDGYSLDQFMVDYFKEEDSIEVNCKWLQHTVRTLNTLNRELEKTNEANTKLLDKVDSLNHTIEVMRITDKPKLTLDVIWDERVRCWWGVSIRTSIQYNSYSYRLGDVVMDYDIMDWIESSSSWEIAVMLHKIDKDKALEVATDIESLEYDDSIRGEPDSTYDYFSMEMD